MIRTTGNLSLHHRIGCQIRTGHILPQGYLSWTVPDAVDEQTDYAPDDTHNGDAFGQDTYFVNAQGRTDEGRIIEGARTDSDQLITAALQRTIHGSGL
jgi:hypothetical protein